MSMEKDFMRLSSELNNCTHCGEECRPTHFVTTVKESEDIVLPFCSLQCLVHDATEALNDRNCQ